MQPTIAIVANKYSDFRRPLVEQMAKRLNSHGYGVLSIIGREIQAADESSTKSIDASNRIYSSCADFPVQGYIVLSSTLSFNASPVEVVGLVEKLSPMPVVSLGMKIPGIPSLVVDNVSGMNELMQHMTANPEHRNYVFLRGGETMPDSIEREAVFREVLEQKGIAVQDDLMLSGNFMAVESFSAMDGLLRKRKDIDVVVAANDIMAVSAIQALAQHGLSVPEDVIVSGFDDRPIASEYSPPLTTVSYGFAEKAEHAVQILLASLNGEPMYNSMCEPKLGLSHLIVRNSSQTGHMRSSSSDLCAAFSSKSTSTQPEVALLEILSSLPNRPPEAIDLTALARSIVELLARKNEQFLQTVQANLLPNLLTAAHISWWLQACEAIEQYIGQANTPAAWQKSYPVIGHARDLVYNARQKYALHQEFSVTRIGRLQEDLHIHMASCSDLKELRTALDNFVTRAAIKRTYIVLYENPGEETDELARVVWFKSDTPHIRQSESAYQPFLSASVMPESCHQELSSGLLVMIPLCVGAISFGYILVDPSGLAPLSFENLATSVSYAISNCNRLESLESQASVLSQQNAKLAYLAKFDSLTGLANRERFTRELRKAIRLANSSQCSVDVLFIDLDGFKVVNDTCGHAVGDDILKQVGKRFTDSIREFDLCARFGGDEFAVLVGQWEESSSAAVDVAKRLLLSLEKPFRLGSIEIALSASIGISRFGSQKNEGLTVEALLKQADTAMYYVKENGKNNFHHYAHDMALEVVEKLAVEQAMRLGIENKEFYLEFQPRIDLASGHIKGFEALMRWKSKNRSLREGTTSPGYFIPLAEAAGLIIELDQLALERACKQLSLWRHQFKECPKISVNMSVARLQQDGLIDSVAQTIERYDIDPSNLELEITESSAMSDITKNIDTLHKLRDLGVSLSIDDFGTGYSSLAYLKQLPVTCLKIDQSFLRGLRDDNFFSADAEIVKTIIALGHSMGHMLVAEGVEYKEQSNFLRESGCEQAQGYYYSRSVPPNEATRMLKDEQQSPQLIAHQA